MGGYAGTISLSCHPPYSGFFHKGVGGSDQPPLRPALDLWPGILCDFMTENMDVDRVGRVMGGQRGVCCSAGKGGPENNSAEIFAPVA